MAKAKKESTQKFTGIIDILDDVVLFENGNACLVIEATATNFALLSKEEQDAKLLSYASLLNSLSFPIQIIIRNKRLNISSYLKLLEEEIQKSQNEKLKNQISLYKNFVSELVKVNTILDKQFYIVVSFSPLEKTIGKIDKKEILQIAKASLHTKGESLHSQLVRINLKARTLKKDELIKLFYGFYNPSSSQGGSN